MTTTHDVHVAPHPRRVQVWAGGTRIADSANALLLTETGHDPVAYVPLADVCEDVLVPTDTHTHCPFKGDASYWSIRIGGEEIADAAWGYPAPLPGAPDLTGHVAFYPQKVRIDLG